MLALVLQNTRTLGTKKTRKQDNWHVTYLRRMGSDSRRSNRDRTYRSRILKNEVGIKQIELKCSYIVRVTFALVFRMHSARSKEGNREIDQWSRGGEGRRQSSRRAKLTSVRSVNVREGESRATISVPATIAAIASTVGKSQAVAVAAAAISRVPGESKGSEKYERRFERGRARARQSGTDLEGSAVEERKKERTTTSSPGIRIFQGHNRRRVVVERSQRRILRLVLSGNGGMPGRRRSDERRGRPNKVKEGDHGRGDLKDGDFHCCYLLVTISE